jgi:hypothetical protein
MAALRIAVVLGCLLAPVLRAEAQTAGISPDGKKGRIHTVVKGDTLWDISASYLGTPWIWPSVWKENADIPNPHLIYPGDRLWITEGEMRKLTPEEAEQFMAAARDAESAVPAAAALPPEPVTTPQEPSDPFAALDSADSAVERYIEVKDIDRYSFVTEEEFTRGSGAVLGAHRPNYWSSQHQRVIVGVGEGLAHVGDTYGFFRVRRRVLHPENSEPLGYFVEVLGRGQVAEVHAEASFVTITMAYAEIQPGDRVIPYTDTSTRIREVFSSDPVEGQVIAYQPGRQRAGRGDMVILDRGTASGLVVGRRLDLFRPGREVRDPLTLSKVLVPDDLIGQAFVIRASSRAALALITYSDTEVVLGDRFRNHR